MFFFKSFMHNQINLLIKKSIYHYELTFNNDNIYIDRSTEKNSLKSERLSLKNVSSDKKYIIHVHYSYKFFSFVMQSRMKSITQTRK